MLHESVVVRKTETQTLNLTIEKGIVVVQKASEKLRLLCEVQRFRTRQAIVRICSTEF